jgi:hypothetical protein
LRFEDLKIHELKNDKLLMHPSIDGSFAFRKSGRKEVY